MKSPRMLLQGARLVIGLSLCCLVLPANAGVSLNYTTINKAVLTSPDDPNSDTAKVGMNIITLSAEIPLYQKMHDEYKKPTVFSNQLAFSQRTLTYDWPASNTEYKPDKVYALGYTYDFVTPLNQKWMLVNFASLGAFTDFEGDMGDKDLVFELGLMGVYQFKNGWDVGIGPAYTRAFGDNQLIPAPYVRYKFKESFTLDVKVPKYAKASYIYQDKMMFTLGLNRTFDAFRLNPDPDVQVSHVAIFSDIKLGLEALFVLYKNIALEVGIARTLYRSLEIKVDNRDDTYERDLDNATVYSVGLQLLL